MGPEVPVTIITTDISLNEEMQRLQRELHRSERLYQFYERENMSLKDRVRVLEFDLARKRATIQKTRAFIFLSLIAFVWLPSKFLKQCVLWCNRLISNVISYITLHYYGFCNCIFFF